MTDETLLLRLLKALGGIEDGQGREALIRRRQNLKVLINELASMRQHVTDQIRVLKAHETASKRIKPGTRSYGVHLRHCYGIDHESADFDEEPTRRYACKYGEDDICPAALFEDPWAEYLRAEAAGELDSG